MRDLLDLDVDVAALLPADDASYGFDNIAGVLKLSPTLMERYLAAAQKISRLAVGTPPPFPDRRLLPRGRRPVAGGPPAGAAARHARRHAASATPSRWTASTRFACELSRDLNEQVPLYAEAQELEVSIDGERVQVFTLPGVGGGGRPRRRRRNPATPRRPTPMPRLRPPADACRQGRRGRRRTAWRSAHGAAAASRASAGRVRSSATASTATGTSACRSRPGTRDVQVAFLEGRRRVDEIGAPAVRAAVSRGRQHRREARRRLPAQRRDQRPVRRRPAPAVAPSRQRIFALPARRRRTTRSACARARSSARWRAARTAAPSTTPTSRRCSRSIDEGRAEGGFERGHRAGR